MQFLIMCFYKNPLYFALEFENTEIIKLLLSCDRIDINYQETDYNNDEYQGPLLYEVVKNENIEIAKLFMECERVNVNDFCIIKTKNMVKKRTALHLAVKIGNIQIIKLLLNHKKINIDEVDENDFDYFL